MTSIHRIVLQRLLLGWLAVSLLAGGLTYYVELAKIDDAVVALAASQATHFAPEGIDTGTRSAGELRILQQKAGEFVKRNFVIIEIYDRQEQRILEVVNPQYEHLEQELKHVKHDFPRDAHSHYEKFTIGDDTVVQVLVPLPSLLGGKAGFFEGVFVVDRSTLAQFRNQLWRTLAAVLFAVLATTVLLYPLILSLNRDVMRFSQEVLKGNLEMASVLGTAIAKRDSDTGEHNYRVTLYAIRLGRSLGLDAIAMRRLILGAFLHDVGKIGISDNILLKPSQLNDEEFSTMRQHVMLGVEIIQQSEWLRGAREVIEGHHEKFDGSGYPHGMKGEAIPLNARIFAVVDVFDALTSRRPYKAPMPLDEALRIIEQGSGKHFDPKLVKRFARIAPALYAHIGSAGEAELLARLRKHVIHYFIRASRQARSGIATT